MIAISQFCRRVLPSVVLVAAGLTVHWLAQGAAQERPNYDRIDELLYMGGMVKSPPPGTKAVLNLCELEDPYKVPFHRWEPIRTGGVVPDVAWLKKQVEFLDAQRQAERIAYVHCRNGVNRAGLVVTAYVMQQKKLTRDQALKFIRSKRAIVSPNPRYMELLKEWEKSLPVRK